MTYQDYTPEEVALKKEIENLATQVQPDADFVTSLETRLLKSEALKSTETAKTSVRSKPRRPFQPAMVWATTLGVALIGTALLIIVGVGLFYTWISYQRQTDTVAVLLTPTPVTLFSSTPAPTFTPTPRLISPSAPTTSATALALATPTPMLELPPTPTPPPLLPTPSPGLVTSIPAAIPPETPPPALPTASPPPPGSNSVPETSSGTQAATSTPPPDMFFQDYGVNPFLDTQDQHLSTFAMDVDTASYTLTRNYLMNVGQLPPAEAIRPEEFINYFDAGYEGPTGDKAFAIHLEAAPAPFGFEQHYLLRVGLQGRYVAPEYREPAFLIFVIDVSGSMDMENRLGLVKESLAVLVNELNEDDRIAIVVYSNNSRVVLNPTPASETQTIMAAINALRPEGSTNVDAGLRLGYQLAEEYMRPAEITRVIVLSDGVANVDVTSPGGILQNIERGVDRGVTLTTIGFGMGNYNDVLMEQLANDGNGNYYYVDNLRQARRIFVHNLTGMLQVIGYDAKVQVAFNPAVVDRFRLIGYENRAIANEDFRNDAVDAGEVGAGHSVTALYEIALEDDDLAPADIIATVYIRYQDADTRQVVEVNESLTIGDLLSEIGEAPASFRLHAAVAEFAELLGQSYWAQDGSYSELLNFALPLEKELPNNAQVAELVEMIFLAKRYE